ncbi:toll/interleukin-1 receptor domain-containing protein [Metabacillus litoralis]|uniref:toll/interleukin-1 receptor domain-containing protein n=1 Tax=Metabacillus litoralis TaxID=152268 RepID=UPI00203F271F|nr:toll/interleukin-1 receptor domain-containing protein [Metabacillus litoralis]MCM3412698.1 toll/interleukin-1 receptor domain-containing protein [Metabacillus litoralis]
MEQKTAFISYSWDSEEHKQWVMDLANLLRRNRVDATIDRFITQSNTTNLNTMMVSNIKNNDFLIVVLTKKFAEKSDNLQGGVGFETMLSLPVLLENPDKLIFILRHKGSFKDAFPFHLKGYYAIDFSDVNNFNDSFQELLHRIYGVPLYEMEPLGTAPQLKPRSNKNPVSSIFSDIEIPNLRRITDMDKQEFLKKSYNEMIQIFEELFSAIKTANDNFDYSVEALSPTKSFFQLFIDRNARTGFKIWINKGFGSSGHNSINLSYDTRQWDLASDNSYNESISCEVNENKELKLKMLMNMFGSKNTDTPEKIVKEIWKNSLSHHIR